ncbi:hypothetical protein AJ87_40735 [Rhizobium yanglingense]|nr:hypothetical protein AJ87_40735 [Rhizobium yanglingense]
MVTMTEELFARLNIVLDPRAQVSGLTVAQKQMVEIARAVSYESSVLIMDEPTSALTDREVEHLFTIIRDLRSRGIGIVYITHKMNELFEIADEFTVFRDGKYVGTHSSKDVTRDDIIRMMVGREITNMFPKIDCPIGDVALRFGICRFPASSMTSRFRSGEERSSALRVSWAQSAPTSPKRCLVFNRQRQARS